MAGRDLYQNAKRSNSGRLDLQLQRQRTAHRSHSDESHELVLTARKRHSGNLVLCPKIHKDFRPCYRRAFPIQVSVTPNRPTIESENFLASCFDSNPEAATR